MTLRSDYRMERCGEGGPKGPPFTYLYEMFGVVQDAGSALGIAHKKKRRVIPPLF